VRLLSILAAGLAAAALALPASAEPALWKVQGPHATVYLFGTVHVLRKTTVWRSAKIETAFKSAGTLWEELKDADDPAAMQPLIFKYGLDPTHALSAKLDPTGQARLTAVEATLGLPPAQLDPERPWLAALTLELVPLVKAGYDINSGVDKALKADADASGKPLQAFETAEQQVRFFADLPQKLEVDYLLSTLDDADKGSGELDALVDAWAAGDTRKMEALLNGDMIKTYPELYRILLADRNKAFAAKIEQLLKGEGVVFVAIGAAHLVGPDSVQADLARDGITAVRQ
jgi:hypothetical protein